MLLQRWEYDAKNKRAYVEFRGREAEAVVAVIFSFETTEKLTKARLRAELERIARSVLKGALKATEQARTK
jgi:hypothetical protein